jgi:exonuclease SbcC
MESHKYSTAPAHAAYLRQRRLRHNQLVKDLQELKQTHFKLYNTLLDKLVSENIQSVEALKALFLPEEIAKQIAETEKRLEGDIKASTQLLASIQLEFETESVKNLTSETEETLLPQSQNLEKAISELNQEIGGINNILEHDNQLKAKFAELAEALQLQKKEHAKWAKLSDLIGSADGKKFRRFAQGLTLARLTEFSGMSSLFSSASPFIPAESPFSGTMRNKTSRGIINRDIPILKGYENF